MTPLFRKFALTTHITFSVGWFGAVAAFLALAIVGLTSQNSQVVRSVYQSIELIGWFVIVPACLCSLLSGIVQSFGTTWGLFQHYWVLIKFFLTVAATIILLVHMKPIGFIANIVSTRTISDSELNGLRLQLIIDASAALFVLLVATALSVYKPWGRTSYGLRKYSERNKKESSSKATYVKPMGKYLLYGMLLILILFLILHLTVNGLGGH